MRKKIIGIYDREERYAARLMEVFNARNRMGFQAELFTSMETLIEYSRTQPIEILLIGDSLMQKQLEYAASMIIIISEGTKVAEQDTYFVVYKYQSSELIIRKVMEYYGEHGANPEELCKPKMKVYGIYAPQNRSCKSEFAWNLARKLGQQGSVLYVNLTAFSGRNRMSDANRELSDIMYYVRNGFDNLIYLVGSAVSNVEGIDCLPCMSSLDDLQQVFCEDWIRLLHTIMLQSHYDALVIELEECVQQFYRILDICSDVYFPVSGEPSGERWEQCRQYFEKMGAGDVWKRGEIINVDRSKAREITAGVS